MWVPQYEIISNQIDYAAVFVHIHKDKIFPSLLSGVHALIAFRVCDSVISICT